MKAAGEAICRKALVNYNDAVLYIVCFEMLLEPGVLFVVNVEIELALYATVLLLCSSMSMIAPQIYPCVPHCTSTTTDTILARTFSHTQRIGVRETLNQRLRRFSQTSDHR